MAACGDSSSGASGLSVMADDSHLVAVGYRELSRAQRACVAAVQAGEIQKSADAARCLDDGFTASKLEQRIEVLRQQVLAVGQAGSDACKKEADALADLVQTEKSALLELHDDLLNEDAAAYTNDLDRAEATAGKENARLDALLKACA
jgi:hypothetical protein